MTFGPTGDHPSAHGDARHSRAVPIYRPKSRSHVPNPYPFVSPSLGYTEVFHPHPDKFGPTNANARVALERMHKRLQAQQGYSSAVVEHNSVLSGIPSLNTAPPMDISSLPFKADPRHPVSGPQLYADTFVFPPASVHAATRPPVRDVPLPVPKVNTFFKDDRFGSSDSNGLATAHSSSMRILGRTFTAPVGYPPPAVPYPSVTTPLNNAGNMMPSVHAAYDSVHGESGMDNSAQPATSFGALPVRRSFLPPKQASPSRSAVSTAWQTDVSRFASDGPVLRPQENLSHYVLRYARNCSVVRPGRC